MNHAQAIATHTADRYLIDDLSIDERTAFEGHYSDCKPCATEVKLGAIFAANVRAVLKAAPECFSRQISPAFAELHHYEAVVDEKVRGVFSNALTAMETAGHETRRLDLERRRTGVGKRPVAYYVRDRRTGERLMEHDLLTRG